MRGLGRLHGVLGSATYYKPRRIVMLDGRYVAQCAICEATGPGAPSAYSARSLAKDHGWVFDNGRAFCDSCVRVAIEESKGDD